MSLLLLFLRSAQSATIAQVTETDTAQALSTAKRATIAQVSEVDTAQAVTRASSTRVTEFSDDFNRADANPPGAPWIVHVGQWDITSNALRQTYGAAQDDYIEYDDDLSDVDQWCEVTVTSGSNQEPGPLVRATSSGGGYSAGYDAPNWNISKHGAGAWSWAGYVASAIDSAPSYPATLRLEAVGSTINLYVNGVLKVSGTDATHTGTRAGLYLWSAATFDDWKAGTFAAAGGPHVVAIAQVAEIDTALSFARVKAKQVAQATETDLALILTRGKRRALAQLIETDSALGLAATRKARAVLQVQETDTARPFTPRKTRPLVFVAETDLAQALTRRHTRTIGLATEIDTALVVAGRHLRTLGLAVETDTALPVSRGSQAVTVNQLTETDTTLGLATRRKTKSILPVTETDVAGMLGRGHARLVEQVSELDLALAVLLAANRVGVPLPYLSTALAVLTAGSELAVTLHNGELTVAAHGSSFTVRAHTSTALEATP